MKRIKNGYISIEVVIIFTMIFMFGIFAVGRFVFGGQNVSDKESEAFKETYNTIYEGVGSGSIVPGPPIGGGGVITPSNKTHMISGKEFRDKIHRVNEANKIKSIEFVDAKVPSSGVTEIVGLDLDGDGGVVGWYSIDNADNKAKVYISSQIPGQKIATDKLGSLFAGLDNVELLDVTLLDVSKINGGYAWGTFMGVGENAIKLKIVGLDTWDTSKIETTGNMFSRAGKNATSCSIGDLSKWDTNKFTDIAHMFYMTCHNSPEATLDMSNWNLNNVNSTINVIPQSNFRKLKTPKNLKNKLNLSGAHDCYDLDDNNKKYPNCQLPMNLSESHTLIVKPIEVQ